MKSFIVRIYRTAENDQRRIVGVVEQAGEEGKKAFTQYDELWEILTDAVRGAVPDAGKAPRTEPQLRPMRKRKDEIA